MDETTSLLRREPSEVVPEKKRTFPLAISLAVITGAIFLLVARNIPADIPTLTSTPPQSESGNTYGDADINIDTLSLHVSIQIDDKTGLATLIDRAPVMCRHSAISSTFTCPEGATAEIATADYKVNLNGNGWNYLSIETIDMRELEIDAADRRVDSIRVSDLIDKLRAAGDLSLVRQQYVRSMHAIGLLEGFLSCKQIGEWYANFYDGLFEGGEVNRPTMEFLEQNHVWMNEQAALYWEVDEYWMVIKGILSQLEGLLIGAQNGCPGVPFDSNTDDAHSIADYKGVYMPSMEHGVAMQHFLLMNANGDMFQIMQKYPANLVNTTQFHRHGDGSIDTEPAVDDYVDDYTIMKAHNVSTTVDDDEAYAYGDTFEAESPVPSRRAQSEESSLFYMPGRYKASEIPAGNPDAAPRPLSPSLTKEQILALPNIGADHCSAIIKVLPDLSDVVFGHDTWDEYQTAFPRVFKHIRYNRMKNSMPIKNDMIDLYFSASPGLMASIDDFYIIHGVVANLAVTETSLDMYNEALVDLINPSTMLCWARAIAANRIATSGNSWVETFSRYHSGTYANQWMVLDFNRFEPFQQPRQGFLTVLEELPGIMHHEDVTDVLVTKSYWASYNNPYFKEISVLSGVQAKCELDFTYCHLSTPRAKIFREHQGAVRNVGDLQQLMQYNQYATDPLSKSDSCKAIACRKDLEPAVARRAPFGAIDAKVSSANLASRRLSESSYGSSLRGDSAGSAPAPATAVTTLGRVVRQSAYYGVVQPVVLVKLGPTIDGAPPFCWTAVGPTTADTTVASPAGMSLPASIAHKNISAPDPAESSNTRRRLRAETTVAGSESSEDEKAASAESGEDSVPVPVAPAPVATASAEVQGPVPTAAPTFLEGPRVFVHWGHPECFEFGWETMPPPTRRN